VVVSDDALVENGLSAKRVGSSFESSHLALFGDARRIQSAKSE